MTGRFGFEVVFGVLAFVGLWVTVDKTTAGLMRAWAWLAARRDGVDEDDEPGDEDWGEEPDPLEELPPERTWEQLTHRELPLVGPVVYLPPVGREPEPGGGPPMWEYHRPERERRAPWWEAEHRAAYDALGFDYPSGLMARVRELTP